MTCLWRLIFSSSRLSVSRIIHNVSTKSQMYSCMQSSAMASCCLNLGIGIQKWGIGLYEFNCTTCNGILITHFIVSQLDICLINWINIWILYSISISNNHTRTQAALIELNLLDYRVIFLIVIAHTVISLIKKYLLYTFSYLSDCTIVSPVATMV